MLAWLVNNNYLSKIDLADSCYTLLKIHEVLFPLGSPISMEGFTGYLAESKTNDEITSTPTSSDSSTAMSLVSENQTKDIAKISPTTALDDFSPGNFTLDNAKLYLHQFMQRHNTKAEYEYDSSGPAHQK